MWPVIERRAPGRPHLEERELMGRHVWVAVDDVGVAAIADTRDDLVRLLRRPRPEPVPG